MDKSQLRGIRNNNPGNIDYNENNPWQGRLPHVYTIEPRFERFESPQMGIRALARLLITYSDKHNAKSITQLIKRYAPPHENGTDAYVTFVARRLGISPTIALDVHRYDTMKPLVEAIIAYENKGYVYPEAVVDAGLALAGVVKPTAKVTVETKKPILKDAGTWERVATATGGGLLTVEAIRQTREVLAEAKGMQDQIVGMTSPDWAVWVGAGLVVIAVVLGVTRIIAKRRALS